MPVSCVVTAAFLLLLIIADWCEDDYPSVREINLDFGKCLRMFRATIFACCVSSYSLLYSDFFVSVTFHWMDVNNRASPCIFC